jgi:hypothetical protein
VPMCSGKGSPTTSACARTRSANVNRCGNALLRLEQAPGAPCARSLGRPRVRRRTWLRAARLKRGRNRRARVRGS